MAIGTNESQIFTCPIFRISIYVIKFYGNFFAAPLCVKTHFTLFSTKFNEKTFLCSVSRQIFNRFVNYFMFAHFVSVWKL